MTPAVRRHGFGEIAEGVSGAGPWLNRILPGWGREPKPRQPKGVAARIGGAPKRGAGAPVSGDATEQACAGPWVLARSRPAPGSHPSTHRLEPAPPSTGPLSRGLPIRAVLAAPRFAPSPILTRNALAFHRVTGSRRGLLYPLSCWAKLIIATNPKSDPRPFRTGQHAS